MRKLILANASPVHTQLVEALITPERVIQAQTPMRQIYHDLSLGERDFVLIGGAHTSEEVCEEYGFEKYISVRELAGMQPVLVPLSYKAGYPGKGDKAEIIERVQKRFKLNNLDKFL
jgi:ribonucleotide monophosphatase NagD (HAD superfamily)